MTDHGAFVLVNIYGPAISSAEKHEERFPFKMLFYQARVACTAVGTVLVRWYSCMVVAFVCD